MTEKGTPAMTATVDTDIDTSAEITRENAADMLFALVQEEQQLRPELDEAADPAPRAEILRRGVLNQQRQVLACERRPGRTRDKQRRLRQCRDMAQLLTAAADIEQLRAETAGRGNQLPDPLPLLKHIELRVGGSDEALDTMLALYAAAAPCFSAPEVADEKGKAPENEESR